MIKTIFSHIHATIIKSLPHFKHDKHTPWLHGHLIEMARGGEEVFHLFGLKSNDPCWDKLKKHGSHRSVICSNQIEGAA